VQNIVITNSFTFLWELEIVFDSFGLNNVAALFPRLISINLNAAAPSLQADLPKLQADEAAFRKIFSNPILLDCKGHVEKCGGKRKPKTVVPTTFLTQGNSDGKKKTPVVVQSCEIVKITTFSLSTTCTNTNKKRITFCDQKIFLFVQKI